MPAYLVRYKVNILPLSIVRYSSVNKNFLICTEILDRKRRSGYKQDIVDYGAIALYRYGLYFAT